jgi:hypothetical protein
MEHSRRAAGAGILVFSAATLAAMIVGNAPGGDFRAAQVTAFVARSHAGAAWTAGYLGIVGALGLLLFIDRMRERIASPSAASMFAGLGIAATGAAAVGWTMIAGISVAHVEGGSWIRIAAPIVNLVSEMSVLVALCAPACLAGTALLILVARAELPGWLRAFTAVAAVCAIVAPLFFPLFLYLLWGLIFGLWSLVTSRREVAPAAMSAVGVS